MRTYFYAAALFAAAQMTTIVASKAEVLHYTATLTGPAEAPPTDSKGTGTLTATYDTDTKKLEWTVDYSGLTGPAIAAHFHGPAPVGKAAPIEVPLKAPLDSPMTGLGDADRRSGQGPDGRHDVLQHPHRRQQAG